MMRQIKSIVLTVALCVAGVMVAQGRDFGLVSIPDALNPQPRPEDVYECTAMIPLPKGGNVNVYHVYAGGTTDVEDGLYGFSVPDLTERNILSLLASAADQDRLIQLPISGKTWFGCAYARRSDGESVIYEGAVVVEGAYFVVQFQLPPTQPLDREVMDILAQIRLRPGRVTKTRKMLDAIQGTDGLSDEERRDACKMACVQAPESVELLELLKASAENVGDSACADWCSRQLVRLNPAIYRPRNRWNAKSCRALTVGELEEIEKGKAPPPDAMPAWGGFAAKAVALKEVEIPSGAKTDEASVSSVVLPPLPDVATGSKARAPRIAPPTGHEAALARQSHRAPVAVVREQLRELAGKMGDEAAAAFEAKWSAAMDAPSEQLQDWLKSASPILTELVQAKAAMAAAVAQYDETLEEAKAARTFGALERAHALVGQLADVIGEMNALREQMKALAARLGELGEMPDPKELARRDAEAWEEALQTVRELSRSCADGASGNLAEPVSADGNGTAGMRSFNGKNASNADGYWELSEKKFEKGEDKVKKDPQWGTVWTDSYSGSDLHFQHDSAMDGGDKHERSSFAVSCSTEPPRVIAGGETLKFGLSLKTTASTSLWSEESASVFSDDPGLGYGYVTRSCRSAEEERDPKVASVKVSAAKEEKKLPRESSGVFNLKMAVGKRDGQRICIYFRGCGSQTCWIYEWRTGTMPVVTASTTARAPGGEVSSGDFPLADDASVTPEERAERIAFHRENIAACEATIKRLQEELTKEMDPARRAAIEFAIVGERSNIIYEQDRIRAEETGTFKASRTPFDEMCQVQMRENSLREIADWERNKRLRNRAFELAEKLPGAERETAARMVAELMDGGFDDMDKWRRLGDAMEQKYMGYLERDQAMAESDVADREESLRRVQTLKSGCDFVLALGCAGGAPRALSLVYQCGSGYVEKGTYGLVKGVITFYSDVIDVGWSAYDGYKENGWEGAVAEGAKSAFMNYGLPFLVSKMNLTREISFGKKTRPDVKNASVSIKPSELNAMEFEMGKAKQDISDFVVKRNELSALKRGGTATKAQIAAAEDALARSVARLNTSPVAKNMMKYKSEYKAIGAEYDANLQKMITRAQVEMTMEMAQRGYGAQKFEQFRNASSAGTVGMDTDLGVVESPDLPFTLNGKPISKHRYQVECQKVLNEKWKQMYGESAERSWMKITTGADSEAYLNMEILKFSKEADNMSEILAKMSRYDLRQAFDVTGFKANEMMKLAREGKLPRHVAMQEAARGTAKDLKSKVCPMLDSRLKDLRAKKAALKKQGEALSKTDAHNLKRFEMARETYGRQLKALSDVGEGKVDFTAWDDIIRSATGGRDITEFCKDLADFMSSIK